MSLNTAGKYRIIFSILVIGVVVFASSGSNWTKSYAQAIPSDTPVSEATAAEIQQIEVINPYFSIEDTTLSDDTPISGYIINGPSAPLPEYETQRIASMMPLAGEGILPNFPAYNWVFGCSAVSGAMIAAYYDRGAYPNMYTGPTNGGVMTLTDSSWPLWSDGYKQYPNNPLIASHKGWMHNRAWDNR